MWNTGPFAELLEYPNTQILVVNQDVCDWPSFSEVMPLVAAPSCKVDRKERWRTALCDADREAATRVGQ